MNKLLCKKIVNHLVAALLCWAANVFSQGIATAQIQMTTGSAGCMGDATPCSMGIGQQMGVTTGGSSGPVHIEFQRGFDVEVVKNQPYQAQATTEIKQTLANDSHISQTTTATVARDSEGRTVRIQKLVAIGPWTTSAGGSNETTVTTIFDPVANTHTDYTSDNKIAHVMQMPPVPPAPQNSSTEAGHQVQSFGFAVGGDGPSSGQAIVMGGFAGTRAISSQGSNGKDQKTEQLDAKTIEGIQAVGTRSTNTIPAGTIGNDKDIVITHEIWDSPELKLVLLSTQDDPRFGQTTYSLTNIQRGEPSKVLFQVPAGYKIEKDAPHFFTQVK
jgi:hypothetical protein